LCAGDNHDGDSAGNEFGRQVREAIVDAVRPAVFERNVPALDEASIGKALTESITVLTTSLSSANGIFAIYSIRTGIVPRRPSGNVTGFASLEPTLGGKWLELLSEIAPGLKRAAFMFTDTAIASAFMPSLETAARSLKIEPIIAPVHSDGEIETAIIALGREPGGGLVVVPDAFAQVHRAPIILAAARNNVPAVYYFSYFARDGGLLSYGPDAVDRYRRAASYVDRILRGEKPGDLPVQFPTRFEMVVNRNTDIRNGIA
jgi:putative ABC transport system substrate-binding protein